MLMHMGPSIAAAMTKARAPAGAGRATLPTEVSAVDVGTTAPDGTVVTATDAQEIEEIFALSRPLVAVGTLMDKVFSKMLPELGAVMCTDASAS